MIRRKGCRLDCDTPRFESDDIRIDIGLRAEHGEGQVMSLSDRSNDADQAVKYGLGGLEEVDAESCES